jgi:hypothetical protein
MKKRISFVCTVLLLVTVLISLSIFPALALGVTDFTASLSVARRMNYVGDEVSFTVHIENTGDYEILNFSISNTRGGVIKSYGELEPGESADIPVTKVFSAAGEYGVKFKVSGSNSETVVFVTTNTVTVTINDLPTPTPEPTPEPTAEPTPEQTPKPTLSLTPEPTLSSTPTAEPSSIQTVDDALPTPAQVAVINEENQGGTTLPLEEKSLEKEESENTNTMLYIILAVVVALLLAAVAVIIVLKQKMKAGKGK